MGSLPPSIVTSTPGQTAQQVSNSLNNSGLTGLYNILEAYKQQSLKNSNKNLRFTLSIPVGGQTVTFQAHLDPNHLLFSKQKRVVELDVLTGVVVQDFGFNAASLELKGTTGSAYYNDITKMQNIFDAQSGDGTPTSVAITIEGFSYKATWKEFSYDRQNTAAGGNTINYSMNFIVLSRQYSTSVQFLGPVPSPSASSNATYIASNYASGTAVTQNVSTNGLTPRQYLKASSEVGLAYINPALDFVSQNWNPAINGGVSYPGNDYNLLSTQLLTIPNSWADYLIAAGT